MNMYISITYIKNIIIEYIIDAGTSKFKHDLIL